MQNLSSYLSSHDYPGRGVLIGTCADGKNAVIAYFIMGRSENSRNRVFETTEDGIRTKAFDPAKMVDPSLIIYHPVRALGDKVIVTNGDQTDTIRDYLAAGKTVREALSKRTFEPDGPNFTPRISGILNRDGSYELSILKSLDGDPNVSVRSYFTYDAPKAGVGHLIHTYEVNENPLPSFRGEPRCVEISGDIDSFTAQVWENLNEDNKVSLYVRFQSIETGEAEIRIVNRHA